MRKKYLLFFILVTISISGCQVNDKTEQDSKNQIEYFGQETNDSVVEAFDGLVYKEYSRGAKFHSGEIVISKETLLNATKEPKAVVVYYNDKLLETIDYNNADIQFNLAKEGMYCFELVDNDNNTMDFTSQIQGTSYLESEAVY